MGRTLVRPGFPPWRKWLRNWLPMPPVDPIGLTPWQQLHEGTHHVPLPKEGHLGILPQRGARGNSLQANQPTGSPTTPHHWPPSHLPLRFEWVWWARYDLPTRTTGQWCKSYHRQACLPGNWYPAIPSGVGWTKRYCLLVRYPPLW